MNERAASVVSGARQRRAGSVRFPPSKSRPGRSSARTTTSMSLLSPSRASDSLLRFCWTPPTSITPPAATAPCGMPAIASISVSRTRALAPRTTVRCGWTASRRLLISPGFDVLTSTRTNFIGSSPHDTGMRCTPPPSSSSLRPPGDRAAGRLPRRLLPTGPLSQPAIRSWRPSSRPHEGPRPVAPRGRGALALRRWSLGPPAGDDPSPRGPTGRDPGLASRADSCPRIGRAARPRVRVRAEIVFSCGHRH